MASQELLSITELLMQQRDELRKARGATAAPTVEEMRTAFEQNMAALPEVPGVTTESVTAGGVPAEWTHPQDAEPLRGTLLYFHGGGYFEGSIATHRRLVTSLCLSAGTRGLSVGYRLAPEHPHPAAVQDALGAYRWLTTDAGEDPSRVIVAGDSAGGGLSAALLVALRDAGDPLPAGAYLMSPWVDLASTGESIDTRADVDPFLEPGAVNRIARFYAPDGDVKNPLISPLYADLTGTPPLLIQVGDLEVLLDDSVRLADRARSDGVSVELEVWPEAFHVFQMLAGMVPEADEAIAQASEWMLKRLEAG